MAIRSMLDSIKEVFVIGKDNRFLHGEKRQQPPRGEYAGDEAAYSAYEQPPQQAYQQSPPQLGGYPPYQHVYQPEYAQPYQPASAPYAPVQPQAYGAQQPGFAQQPNPYARPAEQPLYQTQINPEPPSARETQRNRRSQQHENQYQQPQQEMPENVVPFPNAHQAAPEVRSIDAYVVNVFDVTTCRQAISCLRKGHCTLVVIDQLVDKAMIRSFVDMLTGAAYALDSTMTRLSARIGFYVMAPPGMMVYTDPTTYSFNAPRGSQQPVSRVASPFPQQATYQDGRQYETSQYNPFTPPQVSNASPQQPYAPRRQADDVRQGRRYPDDDDTALRYAAQ